MEIVGSLTRLTESDYRRAIDRYVRVAETIPAVLAIFRCGGRTPGISDLDLLIVVDDGLSKPDAATLTSARGVDDLVTFHAPMIVPRSMFREGMMLMLLIDLEPIYAAPGFDDRAEDVQPLSREMALSYLLETSIYRHFFANIFCYERDSGIRKVLTHLWKLKRNVDLCRYVGLEVPERVETVVGTVIAMREGWSAAGVEPDRIELRALLAEAPQLWRSLFSLALGEVAKDARGQVDLPVVCTEGNERLIMDPAVSDLSVEISPTRIFGKERLQYTTRAPIPFLYHLLACGFPFEPGGNPIGHTRYAETMSRRAALVSAHADFSRLSGVNSSPMPMGSFPLLPAPGPATLVFDRLKWLLGDAWRSLKGRSSKAPLGRAAW